MILFLSAAWKLELTIALGASILLSACARAPNRAVSGRELRRLLLCALSLYVTGGFASVTDHGALAGLGFASGIATCALAAWLSRGRGSEDPPRTEEPAQPPPPDPDGLPELDWAAFERELRDYAQRESPPVVRGY